MTVSAIVAVSRNDVIGKDGKLPWNLPAEIAHFRKTTLGHPVIMGRKTHESIGRPLPGRQNIIITSDKDYKAEGCEIVNSLEAALKAAGGAEEVFIIGGQSIFEQAMPLTKRIYLTTVQADFDGDRFFHLNRDGWKVVKTEEHPADADNKFAYEFELLQKSEL